MMGRNYLGFEIAEEYIPLINKRLMQKPIDHFLSYSSEANASSSANAESLIGIKRKPCEVSQIPNGTSLNSDIIINWGAKMEQYEIRFQCINKEVANIIKAYIDCLQGVKMAGTPKLIRTSTTDSKESWL